MSLETTDEEEESHGAYSSRRSGWGLASPGGSESGAGHGQGLHAWEREPPSRQRRGPRAQGGGACRRVRDSTAGHVLTPRATAASQRPTGRAGGVEGACVRARMRTGAVQAPPSGALAAWVPGMLICDLRLKSHCQGLPRNHDLGCSSSDPQSRSPSAARASPSSLETTEADGPRKLLAGPLIRPSDDLSDEVQSLADW